MIKKNCILVHASLSDWTELIEGLPQSIQDGSIRPKNVKVIIICSSENDWTKASAHQISFKFLLTGKRMYNYDIYDMNRKFCMRKIEDVQVESCTCSIKTGKGWKKIDWYECHIIEKYCPVAMSTEFSGVLKKNELFLMNMDVFLFCGDQRITKPMNQLCEVFHSNQTQTVIR